MVQAQELLQSAVQWPLITEDMPGLGGSVKMEPEDFVVEEIPLYPFSGDGDYLYLWVEKRDMGAGFFLKQLAARLDISTREIGLAGLKDRRAVTRQWVSVPASAASRVGNLQGDGLRLLDMTRHRNKLRAGHLKGNRFFIRIRQIQPNAEVILSRLVERLRTVGLPNYYGWQRFGRQGDTLSRGLELLRCGPRSAVARTTSPFLRRLALSALQAALFNVYLTRRRGDDLARRIVAGDVLCRYLSSRWFRAEQVAVEQARFDRREIMITGPMFGRKMFRPTGEAARREAQVLDGAGLASEHFQGWGSLLAGSRRPLWVYVNDLETRLDGSDLWLQFTLPAGCYATVLLRELTHQPPEDSEHDADDTYNEATTT